MLGRVAACVMTAATAAVVLVPSTAPSAPPPRAASTLTATAIRIGSHPGFVRVAVDFRGGPVITGEIVATDPDPFADGVVRLPLTRRGVRTTAPAVTAHGVSARIVQRGGRIVIRLAGAPRQFKYVGYRALHGPERLALDLYRSRPPVAGAVVRQAPDRCLTLDRFSVARRQVTAAGTERNLFEHSLVVRLRRAGGRIHAQRGVTAAAARWSSRFGYAATGSQPGTLEAVALSAKDGTLDCLVQARVRLGG